jgi:hypothetical protein
LGRAEVPNFTSKVDAALHTNFDWSGKANGVITLTLIPENDRVANGVFNTSGDTELEEFNTTCNQIWPEDVSRISDFGLQLVCQPSSTSSASRGTICKYTVFLFPNSAAELTNTAESQSADFPGLKIGNGHFPVQSSLSFAPVRYLKRMIMHPPAPNYDLQLPAS